MVQKKFVSGFDLGNNKLLEKCYKDESAQNVARYLRSTRKYRGMTQHELAERTRLPIETISALELGLVSPKKIDSIWLEQIATVLEEEVENFYLLLGRRIEEKEADLDEFWLGAKNSRYQVRPLTESQSSPIKGL